MMYIVLNRGFKTLIDDEDADLACFKWRTTGVAERLYAYKCSSRAGGKKVKHTALHRTVAERMGLPVEDRSLVVDHINGNALDNRRSNLRLVSYRDNCRNQKDASNNTSGFKGVHFDNARGKWMASIRENHVLKNLGRFETFEEARDARLAAESAWEIKPRRAAQ
jgi:hypothetical protein